MLTGMTVEMIGIPDKVRGVAAEKGFTQKRIALALGISRTSVVDRFNGRVAFTAPEILTLSRVMRTPVERFFPSEHEETLTSEARAS